MLHLIHSCLLEPQRHHPGIFRKYADRRYKKASYYVQAELRNGFVVPAMDAFVHPTPESPFEDAVDDTSFETRNSFHRMIQTMI